MRLCVLHEATNAKPRATALLLPRLPYGLGITVMTDTEIRIAIAEHCGALDRWILMKRGMYYRPDAKGYTCNISEAWIVPESVADSCVYPHDEPVTKHRAPLPDYTNDLNAMHEAEKTMTISQGAEFRLRLAKNSDGYKAKFKTVEAAMCHATAAQRAEGFLRTVGKWRDA